MKRPRCEGSQKVVEWVHKLDRVLGCVCVCVSVWCEGGGNGVVFLCWEKEQYEFHKCLDMWFLSRHVKHFSFC